MKTVSDVLRSKGNQIWSVGPDTTVFDALTLMADRNIGAVVVRDNDRPVGLLTEREYARQVILKGKASRDTPVRDVMLTHMLFVRPDQTIDECMALMTEKRVRHLLVLEQERLAGILSIGDVVKAVIDHKQFMIDQLAQYIQNG